MPINLEDLTIKKANEHLKNKDFSVSELVAGYKKVIDEKNPEIFAFLEVFNDLDGQAKKAQEKIDKGEASLLAGIPLALKDNILIKGKTASASSKILENYKATYDSTVSKKLKEEGAIFVGRTNMDEFAMGASTENSAYGVTKNPCDTERVPGGSSGGSAASVAMGGVLASLGSDTGGSVRQPASFCGCVGFKPTYGRVSRYGLIAMGSSLDQIGPFTKTVSDAEIIFNLIKGKDSKDSTSTDGIDVSSKVQKKKIGIPSGWMEMDGVSSEVKENFKESVKKLEDLGYGIEEVEMPDPNYSLAAYYIVVPAEISSNLARYDGVKFGLHKEGNDLLEDYFKSRGEGFGSEVKRRIILGTYVLSSGYHDEYYNKAQAVRKVIGRELEKAFEKVDAVVSPTTPTPAFKAGEKSSDPLAMYMADIFTATAGITGIPAISIPSGFSEVSGKKLPLGLQIMAPSFMDEILFKIGKDFLGENH